MTDSDKILDEYKKKLREEMFAKEKKKIDEMEVRLAELEKIALEHKALLEKDAKRTAVDGYVARFHAIVNDTKAEKSRASMLKPWEIGWMISLSDLYVPPAQRSDEIAKLITKQVKLASSRNRAFDIRIYDIKRRERYKILDIIFAVNVTVLTS